VSSAAKPATAPSMSSHQLQQIDPRALAEQAGEEIVNALLPPNSVDEDIEVEPFDALAALFAHDTSNDLMQVPTWSNLLTITDEHTGCDECGAQTWARSRTTCVASTSRIVDSAATRC
jgi:hypothetical protein